MMTCNGPGWVLVSAIVYAQDRTVHYSAIGKISIPLTSSGQELSFARTSALKSMKNGSILFTLQPKRLFLYIKLPSPTANQSLLNKTINSSKISCTGISKESRKTQKIESRKRESKRKFKGRRRRSRAPETRASLDRGIGASQKGDARVGAHWRL